MISHNTLCCCTPIHHCKHPHHDVSVSQHLYSGDTWLGHITETVSGRRMLHPRSVRRGSALGRDGVPSGRVAAQGALHGHACRLAETWSEPNAADLRHLRVSSLQNTYSSWYVCFSLHGANLYCLVNRGTCPWLYVKLATSRFQVRRPNHYTTTPYRTERYLNCSMLYWVPQLLYQIISTLILAVPTDELGPAIGCWFSCRARFPCVY